MTGTQNRRISESDLVLPTLRALVRAGEAGMTTAELQPILRRALKPKGDDLVLLQGRQDDRFSQKVRNLRAHQRLERDNLATFNDGRYFIEGAGRALIRHFSGVDESFNNQGFGEPEISLVLKPETPKAFVEEGQQANVSRKVRKRSRKLRAYAIAHFADNEGTIRCIGCDFEASEKYGDEFNGLIEIHHKQPVALSRVRKVDLAEAVQNLAPLCPTCHRVVHSNSEALLSIEDLQLLVRR